MVHTIDKTGGDFTRTMETFFDRQINPAGI
jgi:hypothetical protein